MKSLILVILAIILATWWLKDPTISVPSGDVSFSYVVKYSGGAGKNDYLPMLVALHGNGDKAKNFYKTALDEFSTPARIVLLQGPLSHGSGNAWPWTPDDFSQYGKAVSEAVDLLALKYPTAGKPALLGFSGGGTMAYYQSVKYGDTYSRIFPVSGQLSDTALGDDLSSPGADVLAFHGTSDRVVSIGGGKMAVKVLQDKGVRVTFTEFDGGHHGIFTNMKSEITKAVEQQLESLR